MCFYLFASSRRDQKDASTSAETLRFEDDLLDQQLLLVVMFGAELIRE